MPRALIGKVDNMQEQMGKERNETLKKWKEILIIKSTVTEMNAFDRLIRKKRGRNIRNIWSNNDWEFSSKLMTDTKPQILEAQKTLCRINVRETTTQHITIFRNTKRKSWNIPGRKKNLTYKGKMVRIALDFSLESM